MRNKALRVYGEELWTGTEARKVKVQGNMGALAVMAVALEDGTFEESVTVQLIGADEAVIGTMACTFAGDAKEGEKIPSTSAVVVPEEIGGVAVRAVTTTGYSKATVEIGLEYLPR
jgi:hypothetical protein